jgi:hypothetical protein
LLMSGFRWLCQRSRHCFPLRPGSTCATLRRLHQRSSGERVALRRNT